MSTQIHWVNAIKDGRKYQLRVFDDHFDFWPEARSSASFWFTPIREQLALQPLVAAAQAAGAVVVPFTELEAYTWYEKEGQINFTPIDGPPFFFHVRPAKKAREFVNTFDPQWRQWRDYRIAKDAHEKAKADAAAEAERKARADEIAQAVAAALAARDEAPPKDC